MEVKLNVPKKLQKYFGMLESENDLIDDCKYLLTFAPGYAFEGEYRDVPVKSKAEAIRYLRCAAPHKYE